MIGQFIIWDIKGYYDDYENNANAYILLYIISITLGTLLFQNTLTILLSL